MKKFKLPTLKQSVTITLIVSFSLFFIIIAAGVFLPTSVLKRLSVGDSANVGLEPAGSIENTNSTQGEAPSATGTNQTESSSTQQTSSTSPAADPTTPTGGGGSSTPSPTPGGTPTGVSPNLTFSASPTTITSGSATTLSWSVNSDATQPVTCTAGGGWSGAKATSGSQAATLTATTSFNLTCTNSVGTSGTKTVSVTVNAPAPVCGPGGTCTSADVAPHNTNGNCWMAVTGSGQNKVYVITSSFNSSHQSSAGKNAAGTKTCGKTISIGTLKGFAGDHSNGSTIGGKNFDAWLSSFYYANYQP